MESINVSRKAISLGGVRCLVLAEAGPLIRTAEDGRALVEQAMNEDASVVAVPVERLDPAFFQLRSGIAGEVIQKVLNYKLKFAVLGDVSSYVAAHDALRDFVIECNRGRDIFFATDESELAQWLERIDATANSSERRSG